jgi:septation ring formation regulator EzrA
MHEQEELQRITVLETEVKGITRTVEKLEGKIDSNYSTLHHRISEMRDDMITNIETKHDKVMEKLDEQTKASTDQHKAISDKMAAIEKWRWMVMGGAIAAGYVLAHLKLEKLF